MGVAPRKLVFVVPDTFAVWGLPVASSDTEITPVWSPSIVGLNTTLIVHVEIGANELPQLFVPLKSGGNEILLIVTGVSPELETVTVFEVLVVPMA